ncbi:integrase (plasmid) [Burkholderia sp. PAMC 26561]|nr:integrase [Burkholderia sp. PAMC 26561]AME28024.1 integrase [Burkholderia sp. PAMC 26561]
MLAPEPRAANEEIRVSTRSLLGDTVWHLDGLRPGGSLSDFSLDWGFRMHDGSPFSDPIWADWSVAAKRFLWSLKVDPPPGRKRVHDGTVVSAFKILRILIRWMAERGCRCFADLNRDAAVEFIDVVAQRPGIKRGKNLSAATLNSYLGILHLLYLQGSRMPEVAIDEPIAALIKRSRDRDRGWLPYTPDEIAVPLVSAALRLIGTPADDVIVLWHKAQARYDEALAAGFSQSKAGFVVIDEIADFRFSTLPGEDKPWHLESMVSTKQVRELVSRIGEACFIVVAYLIGARVSEILGLEVGCIERHPSADGTEQFAYLVGRIYKTARSADGDPHRWVAPAPVERAIAVMERLSAPMRQRSERAELWLSFSSTGLMGPAAGIHLPAIQTIIMRLNKGFSAFIELPAYRGEPWHLNTHQGRKTFARFVGKRDRTGLDALRSHFGHVSRVMTDRGYVGTDFVLDELIDRHAREETRHALEELLTAVSLGGKAGRMIAGRSGFRGRTRDGSVQAYVEFLMAETDLHLGVCDWGYCVYRSETASCLGGEKGPNPALRTQSVCASCVNFAVTQKHRSVWEERRAHNVSLVQSHILDRESVTLAQTRIGECDRILEQLNDAEGDAHAT